MGRPGCVEPAGVRTTGDIVIDQGRHDGSDIACKNHKKYSLSCEDLEALWERCGGRCEACGAVFKPTRRQVVIDHDHRYGWAAVRGLICRSCNGMLGELESPRLNPSFGRRGPGRHFNDYFARSWFMTNQRLGVLSPALGLNRDALRQDLSEWRKINIALHSDDPRMLLIPLDEPGMVAQLLRENLSAPGFGVLVRMLDRLRSARSKRDEMARMGQR